jgi:hypothetical protein
MAVTMWILGSFLLDLCMTTTSERFRLEIVVNTCLMNFWDLAVVYLYRSRTGGSIPPFVSPQALKFNI